jgi:hypothetical protein
LRRKLQCSQISRGRHGSARQIAGCAEDGDCGWRCRGQGDQPEVDGGCRGQPGEQSTVPASGLQDIAKKRIRSAHARESTSLRELDPRCPQGISGRQDQAALVLLLDDDPPDDAPPEDEDEPPEEEPFDEDEPDDEDPESEEDDEEADDSLLAGTVEVPEERLSVR